MRWVAPLLAPLLVRALITRGLAQGGDGVQQALGMLNDELKTAMLLCGCAGVSDIGCVLPSTQTRALRRLSDPRIGLRHSADLVRHETSFHVVAPPARAKL